MKWARLTGGGQMRAWRAVSRRCGLGVVALITSFLGKPANAQPTKDQCIASSETAQKLQHDGRLREARTPFRACSDRACPAVIRDDCVQQLVTIEKATPTIRFIGKEADGTEVTRLTVSMDGKELVERDDAGAWVVDPGDHMFAIAAGDRRPVAKRLIISSGEKRRIESVTFDAPPIGIPPVATSPTHNASTAVERPSTEKASTDHVRYLGYGLTGAGIGGLAIGVVFGLIAKSSYDDARALCPAGASSCSQAGVQGGQDADHQATVSTIAFVAGAALVSAGAILIFALPRDARTTHVSADVSGAGIHLRGTW